MASRDKQVKIMLEDEHFKSLCETAAARGVEPSVVFREILGEFLGELREAKDDPVAMREIMKKLGHKPATIH